MTNVQTVQFKKKSRKAKRSCKRVSVDCSGESRTKQSFKDECDINNIINQYTQTGQFNHVNLNPAKYGDQPGVDFREAMELVTQAQETFESLPSTLRKRFGNDPENFFNFVGDPNNQDEMRDLGLLEPLIEPPEPNQAPNPPVETPPESGPTE